MTRQIVLCGFMGSGKTTIGKALAQKLGWDFLDTDECIEAEQGMSIPQIFAQKGESFFRELEHQTALKLSGRSHCVISTGGQMMAVPRNSALFAQDSSLVVQLEPSFSICYQRIKDSDRPLVTANTPQQLEEIYRQRAALYQAAADVQVDSSQEVPLVVESICALIKKN